MIKGKATLQVIDKNGKIIKEVSQENTITNAYKNLLSMNGFNVPLCLYKSKPNPFYSYTPLYENLFGGILLFSSQKDTSNLNDVIANQDDFKSYIGSAGGTFSGESVYRGTLNKDESYETESGYVFTWDFGTDRTNLDGKTINRICLTSRIGGNAGLAKDLNDTTKTSIFDGFCKGSLTDSNVGLFSGFDTTNYLIPYVSQLYDGYYLCNTKEDEFVTVKRSSDVKYTYTFKRFKIKKELGLLDKINSYVTNTSVYQSIDELDFVEKIEEVEITSSTKKSYSREDYIVVHDEDPTNVYCSSISVVASDKKIYYRKFKLSNSFELLEDVAIAYPSQIEGAISYNYNFIDKDGYIYQIDYNTQRLYKIWINSDNSNYEYFKITDETNVFSHLFLFNNVICLLNSTGFNSGSSVSSSTKQRVAFFNEENRSFIENCFYYGENATNYKHLSNIQTNIYQNKKPVFIVNGLNGGFSDSVKSFPCFNIFTPFFASINNLSEGITKEAGTSLKIRYEITNN